MSKLETNTIDNISGSSTLTIGSTNTTTVSIPEDITLGASGKTITIPSGATLTNSGTATGFGKIGQVLQAVKTDTQDGTSSNTWTDISSLSQSITPSATDSKILVLFHVNCAASTNDHVAIRLLRGSTAIHVGTSGDTGRNVFSGIRFMSDDQYHAVVMAGQYLDSPSTTSATTYKLQVNSNSGYYINRSQTTGGTTTVQRPQSVSGITLMEVLA